MVLFGARLLGGGRGGSAGIDIWTGWFRLWCLGGGRVTEVVGSRLARVGTRSVDKLPSDIAEGFPRSLGGGLAGNNRRGATMATPQRGS